MQKDKESKIWVYSKSPFENNYANTIKFNSDSDMEGFFEKSSLLTLIYYNDTYSQIRKNGTIQVEGRVDKFETATYMRFINRGQMFYAFILDTRYTNENTTNILFEIDVWNTYQRQFFNNSIQGFVEQGTLKKLKSDGSKNIVNIEQGFNVGNRQTAEIVTLGLESLDWLVIVAKPSIQLNENDERVNIPGFPGTFKSFRYFVVPVNLKTGMTYPYTYGGITTNAGTITTLLANFTNTFDSGTNTVNQIINVYTTKHAGLSYKINGGTVIINSIDTGILQSIGGSGVNSSTSANSGITGGYIDSTVDWNIDLQYAGNTFSASMVKRLILWCRAFQVLPEFVLVQIYHESLWGGYSGAVVTQDHNWSGITAWWSSGTEYNATVDITMSLGSARPPSEGGYYVHFESEEDWLAYHMYLISGYPANSGNKWYKTSGVTDFETAARGLFKEGGALVNYASTGMTSYVSAMNTIRNAMRADTTLAGYFNNINNLVWNGSDWLTSDSTSNNDGLIALQSLLGVSIGNGECYAVASYYSSIFGGPGLGAGITGPNGYISDVISGADTSPAQDIGIAYDWGKYAFIVENSPISLSQIRVGDIICWYGGIANNPFASSGRYGHVGICYAVDTANNTVSYYEQWAGVKLKQTTQTWQSQFCKSIVHAPGSFANSGSSSGSVIYSTTAGMTMLEISRMTTLNNLEITKYNLKDLLDMAITSQDLYPEDMEPQIFTSEFCQIKMYDPFGTFYNFSPEFVPMGNDNTVVATSCIGDSNHVHYTIKDYNIPENYSGASLNKTQAFNYGMVDSNPRSITILSDSVETYMQANKNQYEAQQRSFNENAGMLAAQADLSSRNTDLTNRQATYNSNYAIESSKIGLAQAGINALTGVITGGLTGGVAGVAAGAISGGLGVASAARQLGYQQQQGEFTEETNAMRSQSTALANMQAKLSLDQSVRSYNASVKDLDNQPVSVQQIGTDMSWQVGNSVDDIFLAFEIPTKFILENANNYIRNNGVILTAWYDDIREFTEHRQTFNYIKCVNIELRDFNINQSHLNALKTVFITGTRIWNYNSNIDNNFLNLSASNPDFK